MSVTICFGSLQLQAGNLFAKGQDPVYVSLLEDFPNEIKNFDQTTEKPEVIKEFEKNWLEFIHSKKELNSKWINGFSWSDILNDFLNTRAKRAVPIDMAQLESLNIQIDLKGEHSISDPKIYAEQRVGEKISTILVKSKTPVILYGGSLESLASALNLKSESLKVVPSPYSRWGIHKIFLDGNNFSDQKGRFVFAIPPSKEYLKHYHGLFSYLNIKIEKSILNHLDQKKQIQRITKTLIQNKYKIPPVDVLVLGYYNQFQEENPLRKSLTQEIKLSDGLTIKVVQEKTTMGSVNYLLLRSDLAIWGESSSLVVRAMLELKPKAVLFMGSAGGISGKTQVYNLSIPSQFSLDGKQLDIQNIIHDSLKRSEVLDKNIILGSKHGHTNSPIEQTKQYVSNQIEKGIDTYDVEQNLIAKEIIEYNQRNKSNVAFGAINIVTDKPSSFHYDWHNGYDLDKIDHSLKGKTRYQAVDISSEIFRSMPSVQSKFNSLNQCSRVFLSH